MALLLWGTRRVAIFFPPPSPSPINLPHASLSSTIMECLGEDSVVLVARHTAKPGPQAVSNLNSFTALSPLSSLLHRFLSRRPEAHRGCGRTDLHGMR